MTKRPDNSAALEASTEPAGAVARYGLIIFAIVLGWQMVMSPLMQRAPVETAIRLAPFSSTVLSRAAEAEFAAGRHENAAAFGRDALGRSPFDVRALRVIGLTEAQAGRLDQADDILTLAGNWSLRDSPTHAWLIAHRLRQGDYASAFAHADTLARRQEAFQPEVFRLFTLAGVQDPQRSLPVTVGLLAAKPPWRPAYLASLSETADDLKVQVNLAILLQASPAPFSNAELQRLYQTLLGKGQIDAVRILRDKIGRPASRGTVTSGDFDDDAAPKPFQWRLAQAAGVAAEIVSDDLHPNEHALRVDYDGYATARIAEQLMLLAPGSYRFAVDVSTESGDPSARLAWTLRCVTDGAAIASIPAGLPGPAAHVWKTQSGQFDVPDACPAQWLRLETRSGDRRSPTVVWFDRVAISAAG